ncbi:MAG: transcription-repair coupling factor [Candidatus Marinimicrobia bacterium]|nr:transcription-repair coupling factor [Candidatus Neomarinimicrobiota bacterium]
MYFVLLAMNISGQKNVSRETPDLSNVFDLLKTDPDFARSFTLLGHRNSLILNTDNTSFVLMWLNVLRTRKFFPLVVFRSERDAESFYADALGFFKPSSLAWIPLFFSSSSLHENPALENHISRFLDDYYNNALDMVISSKKIFEQVIPDRASLRKYILHFITGEDIVYSELAKKLTDMGYQRSGMAEYCGEFAFRGGIVDIYPYGETYPIRMELLGDKIESVRRFNPSDQNTFEILDRAQVRPASFSSFSQSTIMDILSDNTVVVFVGDDSADSDNSTYNKDIPFKQIFFNRADPAADIRFSIADIDAPRKANSAVFYENMLKEYAHICVFAEHDIIRQSFVEKLGEKATYFPINVRVGFQYKSLSLIVLSGREIYHKEHYVNPNKRFIPERSQRIENLDSLVYGEAVVHVDYGMGIYRGIELLEFKGVKQESMVVEYRNKDRVFVPIRYMNKIFRYSGEKPLHIHLDQIGSSRWGHAKTSTRSYLKKAAFDLLSLYQDRKRLPGFAFLADTPDTLQLEATFPYDETPDQQHAIKDIVKDMENKKIMDRLVCGDVGFGKTEVAIRAAFKAVYSGKQVAVLVPTTMLCFQHYESFHERLESFGVNVSYINRFVSGKALKDRLEDVKNGQIDILIGTHKILSNTMFYKDLGLLIVDEEHRFGVNHKEKIQNIKRRVDVLTLTATPIPRTLQLSLVGLRDITKIDTPPKERLPISTKVMYWNDIEIKQAIQRELDRNGQIFILHNVIEEQLAFRDKIEEMFPYCGVRTAHGKLSGPELENTMLDFYHHKFDILISTTIIESGIDVPNANTLIVMNAHNFGLSQLYQIRGRVGRSYKKAFSYLVVPRGKHINPAAMKRLQTLEYYTDLGSGYQIAMRDLEIRGAGSLFGVEQSGHINRLGYAYFNRMFAEEVESLKSETSKKQNVAAYVPDLHLGWAAYLPEDYINNKDIRISFYRKISEILSSNKDMPSAIKELEHLSWSCTDRFGVMPEEANNLFNETKLSLWLKKYHIESMAKKDHVLIVGFRKNIPVSEVQLSAGKLLHLLNEKNISIGFVSKKHLSAKIGKEFLSAFFTGTFEL